MQFHHGTAQPNAVCTQVSAVAFAPFGGIHFRLVPACNATGLMFHYEEMLSVLVGADVYDVAHGKAERHGHRRSDVYAPVAVERYVRLTRIVQYALHLANLMNVQECLYISVY